MLEAVTRAVSQRLPPAALRGVYFKGSASKPWPDPMDYVPELSDLDLHLWLEDGVDRAPLTALPAALDFAREVGAAYAAACPDPLHWPRLQIKFLNDMLAQPGFQASSATVLHGEPYPGEPPSRAQDRLALLEQGEAALRLGPGAFDKVGPDQFTLLRALAWRVSSCASRLLHLLGGSPDLAWSSPRSVLVQALADLGRGEFAGLYRAYYQRAWDGFESRWRDAAALQGSIELGFEVLQVARDIARSLPEGPG